MTEPGFLRATRDGYDRIAVAYVEHFGDELVGTEDRALLDFAGRILDAGGGPVLDVGSGPGRTTGFLHGAGVEVTGIDLSPAMVRLAGARWPAVTFTVGSMTDLAGADPGVPDGSLTGLVAWYSLIHVPAAERPVCLSGFARALRPGGLLLLAFQAGTGTLHFDEAFGERIDLDFHRLDPDGLGEMLAGAGFEILHRTVRPPMGDERTPHGVVLARRAGI